MNKPSMNNTGFNFIPVSTSLIKEFDMVTASIYGAIFTLSKRSGYSFASHKFIAEELGITRWTILRKIKVLINAGYITDLTPSQKNHVHNYTISKKPKDIEAISTVAESNTAVAQSHTAVAESNSHCSTESPDKKIIDKTINKKVVLNNFSSDNKVLGTTESKLPSLKEGVMAAEDVIPPWDAKPHAEVLDFYAKQGWIWNDKIKGYERKPKHPDGISVYDLRNNTKISIDN